MSTSGDGYRPGITLLVELSADDEARLGPLPQVHRLPAELLREPRVPGVSEVDLVVVGPRVASPVAAAQQAHRHFPDAGVLVLTEPEHHEHVRRSISYAPGVPLELVVRAAEGELADEVVDLCAAVADRRRHRAVLAAVTPQTTPPAAARPPAAPGLGALLEHAPLGVVVCDPAGTVLGWNRRAATLLRLDARARQLMLDNILPGAMARVRAALPGIDGDRPIAGVTASEKPEVFVLAGSGGAEIEVGAVPSQLDDGRLVALVSLLDVTERRQAERTQERLSGHVALLARVSEGLASTLDMREALTRLASAIVPAAADWAAVQLTDENGGLTAVVMQHKDPALADVVAAAQARQSVASSPAAPSRRAARGEGPQLIPDVDEATLAAIAPDLELREHVRTLGIHSVVAVPLAGRYAVHGSLVLVNGPTSPVFSGSDVQLAVEAGRRAAVALDNARLYAQQRDLARELQVSLLTPPPRPALGEIQVRYRAAAHEAQVGGDWYDAFLQPDGTTVLVIGDVIGHDVKAAAGMSQLRGVLRGIGYTTGERPAEILRRVDAANEGLQMRATATALVAMLRRGPGPGEITVRWSSAGHPPPAVLHADGRVTLLGGAEGETDLLLGIDPDAERHDRLDALAPGSTLVLYTDGLVERRGESLDEGLLRLTGVLRGLRGLGPDRFCDALLADMLPADHEDDVAVVAMCLDPWVDDRVTSVPGTAARTPQGQPPLVRAEAVRDPGHTDERSTDHGVVRQG